MPAHSHDPVADAFQMRIYEVRRARMRLLLERYANVTELAAAIGETANYLSRLVKLQKNGRKNLGEGKARKIEHVLGLPLGWLDQDMANADVPARSWPFQFNREVWDNLLAPEKRRAESIILTIINGIESERAMDALKKDAG